MKDKRHDGFLVRGADDRRLRPGRARRQGGRAAVNADNAVGLVLVVALSLYLVIALLFPEKF